MSALPSLERKDLYMTNDEMFIQTMTVLPILFREREKTSERVAELQDMMEEVCRIEKKLHLDFSEIQLCCGRLQEWRETAFGDGPTELTQKGTLV